MPVTPIDHAFVIDDVTHNKGKKKLTVRFKSTMPNSPWAMEVEIANPTDDDIDLYVEGNVLTGPLIPSAPAKG